MARIRVLTALKIKQNLKPGMYADGLGLYLKVRAGNSKSWIFRYRIGGRLRDMGLGPFHTVSLAEAREKAEVCRAMRLKGFDPLGERLKERQAKTIEAAEAVTFEKCAENYIATHKDGWKNSKHADQWTTTLQTYVYPIFKDRPVAAIDDDLVLKVLQPIWKEKTETASRIRGRIERILDWARVKKYRTGDNPARWKGHLDHLLAKRSRVASVVHHAALPIDETPGFVQVLQREETIVARAFEFCILSATRTSETLRMRWDEYDEKAQHWTVPGSRMKAGRDHRIPLTKRSQIILGEMQEIRTSDFVFPGAVQERPLSSMAFLMLLRRLGRNDITAHGFRSTFRDWAAERTDFPNEVVEMALAHTISNKVEAAYRRGDLFDKRRQLAEAWAAFCAETALSKS
ncbi:phage integrase central domain-containing protein [Bradyrhizobium sp. AUGA SZCCT0160]|uniref:tyrosine-type recombinase/integrase n=1 Tax=Bradyrhizobium sp. AUGA SZCCT0160 TaxID=2807662 RepID=UPI001BAE2688|nr:integrase arm-type DNA-binding domain-containing protein [Bradyrhizobium sp. AUGA SZCCT0160]MBR1191466.1 integrase arm-type DNA-binding domain-containing protein [Bradyrhizobium sp. AUGA SZCCT0160]